MDKNIFGILYGFVVFFLGFCGFWFFYQMIKEDTPEIGKFEKYVPAILIIILILGAIIGISKLINESDGIQYPIIDPNQVI